jgi:hypothetical protein
MSITVFLFIKGTFASEVERWVARAQCAAALDTLEKIRALPAIDEIVIATPSREFAEQCRGLGVKIEYDSIDDEFHWGKCLADLVTKYRATIPLYIGGGSGVLMSAADWREVTQRVSAETELVVTNNFFSADFAAWSPGDAIQRIEPPGVDNDLAYRLGERAHLRVHALAKNATTQFDIDTPTDLLTIGLHPAVGKHLRSFLDTVPLDYTRVNRVRALFRDNRHTVMIAGRVSAALATFLENSTMCQWRILSEERGMRASGREERGEVRSLLGFLWDSADPAKFVHRLSELADAAIVDSRVLFAHRHAHPSASDRFHSDLIQPEVIEDPLVKAFTQAMRDAPIPILLGGHSLVSGGMYALGES